MCCTEHLLYFVIHRILDTAFAIKGILVSRAPIQVLATVRPTPGSVLSTILQYSHPGQLMLVYICKRQTFYGCLEVRKDHGNILPWPLFSTVIVNKLHWKKCHWPCTDYVKKFTNHFFRCKLFPVVILYFASPVGFIKVRHRVLFFMIVAFRLLFQSES